MKAKLIAGMSMTLIALGTTAQPAAAYDHYARYDYSNWGYEEATWYDPTYRAPSYVPPTNVVAPAWRGPAWHGGYAVRTFVHKGRGAIAVTQPVCFHTAPSVGAPLYGYLEPGTRLTLLGRGEGWAKVRSKWGTIGYIPEAEAGY